MTNGRQRMVGRSTPSKRVLDCVAACAAVYGAQAARDIYRGREGPILARHELEPKP